MTDMRKDIEQLRREKLADVRQSIMLDESGRVLESCDTIFAAAEQSGEGAMHWFPLMESLFPTVLEMEGPNELVLSKIEQPADFLPGFYDFVFRRKERAGQACILWEIFDYTRLYRDFQLYQQKRNNMEIHRQYSHPLDGDSPKGKGTQGGTDFYGNETAFDKQKLNASLGLDMLASAMRFLPENIFGEQDPQSPPAFDSLEEVSDLLARTLDELPEKAVDLQGDWGCDERFFSLENILYGTVSHVSQGDARVLEASISEDLPPKLHGNPLDLQRVIVGLSNHLFQFHEDCNLGIRLYLHDSQKRKVVLGIRLEVFGGTARKPEIPEVLMRLALIRRILDLHQGKLQIAETEHHRSISCIIPFWRK